ncbi:hypothetical protein [Cellulomonas rhizosphaerae]|uniref:Uncharacterized protein n=1 Tax=Cellulomonas rhizosphaerae TaxID=2293719 RepID=A0A413RJJ3_9CELL|nr:hypothetical protein [Cellulomonas rhizosphaerae]RHA38694.1 hypothetical protein D1825_13245 [Cellulomonas rhizosphaerae]
MSPSARVLSGVFLEFEGQPVSASGLFWGEFAPCGCLCGAMTVDRGNGDVLLTADQARLDMNAGIKALAERNAEDGFVFRLMSQEQYRATPFGCEHEPKWGVVEIKAPEGHAWATTDRWHSGRRTRRRHIVPEAAVDAWADVPPALCGAVRSRHAASWSTDRSHTSDTVTCRKCEAAVAA